MHQQASTPQTIGFIGQSMHTQVDLQAKLLSYGTELRQPHPELVGPSNVPRNSTSQPTKQPGLAQALAPLPSPAAVPPLMSIPSLGLSASTPAFPALLSTPTAAPSTPHYVSPSPHSPRSGVYDGGGSATPPAGFAGGADYAGAGTGAGCSRSNKGNRSSLFARLCRLMCCWRA